MSDAPRPAAAGEGAPARAALIAVGVGFLLVFVAVPLAAVFVEAFSKGLDAYRGALAEPDASAVSMRLVVVSWFITGRPS